MSRTDTTVIKVGGTSIPTESEVIMWSFNLWDAAKNGDVSLVKIYLDAGANVNFKNPNEVIRNNIGYCWTFLSS